MLEAGASLLTGNALVAIHPSRNALAGTAPADPLARTTLAGWHWPWLESAWLTRPWLDAAATPVSHASRRAYKMLDVLGSNKG